MSDDRAPDQAAQPWAKPHEAVVDALGVDLERGLREREVQARRERFGRNTLRRHKSRSKWRILLDQFRSLVVLLLMAAAVVALLVGDYLESGAVFAVVIINAAIGFFMELGAVRSMEALREMTRVSATVLRAEDGDEPAGHLRSIPADQLVPGDVVVVEAGDMVTADLRLAQASKLEADESVLTGESMPMNKHVEPVPADTVLAERRSMLYKGTSVTRGHARGVVVATGMHTELGRVSQLLEDVPDENTPLEANLDELSRSLIWVCVGIAVALGVTNYALGRDLITVVETSIALAIATIPEGLPIVATIALAQGMRRMAKRDALVKHLAAVETLGSTGVIFTDKTGTLTLNHMTVELIETDEGPIEAESWERGQRDDDVVLRRALEVAALCNRATVNEAGEALGDPMEIALLEAARNLGLARDDLLKDAPEVREVAFDEHSKKMATVHEVRGQYRYAIKGAPEAVFEIANAVLDADANKVDLDPDQREQWQQRNTRLAGKGLRILALAEKVCATPDEDPYVDVTLLGLVALVDPPREDVRDALAACHRAGIRVIMVTGDQPVTARYIAEQVGLLGDDESDEVVQGKDVPQMSDEALRRAQIFARVDPEQKLDLVDLHQRDGQIVAMTGDGVNDAPALRKADIGVAMGKRGTQVAREAADIVLRDDAFSSIVAAVERGRIIFGNIRKFVLYLLSCNISEIAVIAIAAAAFPNLPLPITPLQILFLNLVTDVFPALALGVGSGDEHVMEMPPRDPESAILSGHHWRSIVVWGVVITASTLAVYSAAQFLLEVRDDQAVTMAFLTLASAQLFHVFNMRDADSAVLDNAVVRNRWVWAAIGLCLVLLVVPFWVPMARQALSLTALGPSQLAVVAAGGFAPALLGLFALWRPSARSEAHQRA